MLVVLVGWGWGRGCSAWGVFRLESPNTTMAFLSNMAPPPNFRYSPLCGVQLGVVPRGVVPLGPIKSSSVRSPELVFPYENEFRVFPGTGFSL